MIICTHVHVYRIFFSEILSDVKQISISCVVVCMTVYATFVVVCMAVYATFVVVCMTVYATFVVVCMAVYATLFCFPQIMFIILIYAVLFMPQVGVLFLNCALYCQ